MQKSSLTIGAIAAVTTLTITVSIASAKDNEKRIQSKERTRSMVTQEISATPEPTPESNKEIVRTRLKRGAQFSYNETTGFVTLTTPSGNTHTLNLSQSAINNMFRTELNNEIEEVDQATDSANTATESAAADEEEKVITETVTEPKKLFGIVPVKIKMNITINTTNGEASIEPRSFIVKLFGFLFTN